MSEVPLKPGTVTGACRYRPETIKVHAEGITMIKTILCAAALGITLGGCMSTSSSSGGMMASSSATSTMAFAPMATSSNMFEIESSRLAVRRSRDPQVRRLANEMIRDHTRASRRMMMAARSAGMQAPPPMLNSRHQAMLEQLSSTPASEFDATYLTMQAQAHEEAVTLFRTYSQNGDDPRMVAFARETLPTLEMHADHVQGVSESGT